MIWIKVNNMDGLKDPHCSSPPYLFILLKKLLFTLQFQNYSQLTGLNSDNYSGDSLGISCSMFKDN